MQFVLDLDLSALEKNLKELTTLTWDMENSGLNNELESMKNSGYKLLQSYQKIKKSAV